MRKISKTLAMMSLLAPLGANALGIGDIKLHSALNQSLNAEIPLVTSGGEEIGDIHVSLGSPEAFSRAGIERHYALTRLRFTPVQKADGNYVIKVTSPEAIRDTFLNFLVEIDWPQGHLQREFTVLLDPPASFKETTAETTELPETEAYRGAAPVERPRLPAVPAERVVRPQPKPPALRETAAPTAPITGTPYGPVSPKETLWNIARKVNPDGTFSQGQMLTALYQANPRAFFHNDINALKAGENLVIPDRETIIRLAGQPRQAQLVRKAGKPTPGTEPITGAEAAAGGEKLPRGQLKLAAPAEGKTKAETAATGEKEAGARTREEIALEIADTAKQQSEEINRRLAEMEQKLSAMQRLLSLKDEQIAALQAQQKQAPPVQPGVQVPPSLPQIPEAAKPIPTVPPARPSVPTAPPQPQPTVQAPQVPATVPQQPIAPAVPTAPPPQPVPKPPAPLPKPPAPTPVKPTAPEEKSFLWELFDEYYYLFGGAAGFLALGAAIWFVKRRRIAMIEEMESILTLGEKEKSPQTKATASTVSTIYTDQSPSSSKSSFMSEFTPSDFNALGGETEEVDPISEADVYLAYGRYKQAEELIHSAIEQHPERDECKLKLLEIHYATENAQAFEKYATELAQTHRQSKPQLWEKVADMGRELCPDSPLFREGGQAAPSVDKHAAAYSPTPEIVEDKAAYSKAAGDFGEAHVRAKTQIADEALEEKEAHTAFDFDIPYPQKDIPEIEAEALDESALDFGDSYTYAPPSPDETAEKTQDKSLDDILAELGALSEEEQTTVSALPAQEEAKPVGNEIEFDFDFLKQPEKGKEEVIEMGRESLPYVQPLETEGVGDEEIPYASLSDMDEQETKLDLAKAYFDMGDRDTAREILQSVAEKGNEAQQREAQALLAKIDQ